MKRHGYQRAFALGSIAGSSCLGMLIPPSVLMIVWGILTEKSIGALFLAGVVPGLMVAGLFCLYILGAAILKPELVGAGRIGDRLAERGFAHRDVRAGEVRRRGHTVGPLAELVAPVSWRELLRANLDATLRRYATTDQNAG